MPHNEVYYVNYPKYNIADGIADVSLPVGHAGVLLKDQDGKYRYFEYGVYTDHVYGKEKADNMKGNWRSIDLTSNNIEDAAQELFQLQGKAAGSDIRMTRVNSNVQDVLNAINSEAYNSNRKNYCLAGYGVNNCGSNASKAINQGLDRKTQLKNRINSKLNRIISTPLSGIPELIMGKGATSNFITQAATSLVAPHLLPVAQTYNVISGENTTNDFETQYATNKTYTFKRR